MPKAALVGCPPSGAFKFAASLLSAGSRRPIWTRPTPTMIFVSQSETSTRLLLASVPAGGRGPGGAEGRPRDPEQQADQAAREERAAAGYVDRRREDTPTELRSAARASK